MDLRHLHPAQALTPRASTAGATLASRRPLVLLFLLLVLAGCGAPRYGVPPVALRDGEGWFGFEVGWDAANVAGWEGISLNGFAWFGVSDTDAVGLGFRHSALLFPTVSWAHHGRSGDPDLRWLATAHADLTAVWAGPVAEVTLGGAWSHGTSAQAFTAGAALLGPPGRDPELAPTLRYVGRQGDLRWEFDARPGRARSALTRLKRGRLDLEDAVVIEVAREDIAAVARETRHGEEGRVFTLHDGRVLRVTPTDPYVDCIPCAHFTAWMNRFPAAPGNRVWWIEWEGRWYVYELDMKAALVRLEQEGVLRLEQAPDLVERTLERYDEWWRDLSVGVGWFRREAP